jgi:hypothetical protein
MLAFLSVLFALSQTDITQITPDPVVSPTVEQLNKVWDKGYEDARFTKGPYRARKPATRGLGKYSDIYFFHPRLRAYESGLRAGRLHLENRLTAREQAVKIISEGFAKLWFHGDILIQPRSVRDARVKDLRGFHVEMIVGGVSYQPLSQPGDLLPTKDEYWVDTSTTVTNSDGTTTTIQGGYYETTYTGDFDIAFSLLDSNGKPRLTSADTITVIVSGGFGSYKAVYKLDAFKHAFE